MSLDPRELGISINKLPDEYSSWTIFYECNKELIEKSNPIQLFIYKRKYAFSPKFIKAKVGEELTLKE